MPLRDLVEKPPVDEAPSNLIIIGRYVLTPDVFDEIERLAGQRRRAAAHRRPACPGGAAPFHGVLSRVARYDTGNPLGFLRPRSRIALHDPEMGEPLRDLPATGSRSVR